MRCVAHGFAVRSQEAERQRAAEKLVATGEVRRPPQHGLSSDKMALFTSDLCCLRRT